MEIFNRNYHLVSASAESLSPKQEPLIKVTVRRPDANLGPELQFSLFSLCMNAFAFHLSLFFSKCVLFWLKIKL